MHGVVGPFSNFWSSARPFFADAVSSNTVRKSIARVLTVVNQKQRQNLREFYKKSKYIPQDLRYKKTRAIRRRLTTKEASAITLKAHKKAIHFPQRSAYTSGGVQAFGCVSRKNINQTFCTPRRLLKCSNH